MKTINPKELTLAAVLAVLSIVTFWYWSFAIADFVEKDFKVTSAQVTPLFFLVLTAAIFGLSAIFIKNSRLLYTGATVATLAPFFFVRATGGVLAVLVLALFLMVIAIRRTQKEFALSLGFSLSKIIRSGIPIYFTLASLIVSTYYFSNLNEERALASFLPKPALEFTVKLLAGSLKSITGIPLRAEATVDEVLTELVKKGLEEQGLSFSRITPEVLRQAVTKERETFAAQYKIKLQGDEKIIDVLQSTARERIQGLLGPASYYLPALSTLTFFFAFKALTLPLYFIALLAAWILLKLMIIGKILKSEKQEVAIERLTL
ncbi:MAG: hypothetical protein HYW89_00020 [Candidatus Sungiibacteriota bacterium]|uniref:Uncharacterized protein n=1 Tax=Candidatus Sungiibacteriota bacterium TaxID=2750080 RepID=A0A7T5UQM2_9BACT|nr:MAG: hypothetical protein HYW89_00020 [Candidatus Sungbacteria bacterium]